MDRGRTDFWHVQQEGFGLKVSTHSWPQLSHTRVLLRKPLLTQLISVSCLTESPPYPTPFRCLSSGRRYKVPQKKTSEADKDCVQKSETQGVSDHFLLLSYFNLLWPNFSQQSEVMNIYGFRKTMVISWCYSIVYSCSVIKIKSYISLENKGKNKIISLILSS